MAKKAPKIELRTCTRCKREQPITNWTPQRRLLAGTPCKTCCAEYTLASRLGISHQEARERRQAKARAILGL